jgi:zinc transport system substrate-binding protein
VAHRSILFVFLLTAVIAVHAEPGDDVHLTVVVSILPQLEIVEHIGGSQVTAMALVPPGSFPATYDPTPKQMATLYDADLWIQIGIPFEHAITRRLATAAPELPLFDGCTGIPRRPIDRTTHGAHTHGTLDPHIWLDPALAAQHAGNIAGALCAVAPESCSEFKRNLRGYRAELEAVDTRISTLLSLHRGSPIFVFHPAYGYFADRYGLVQIPVEVDGKVPTGRRLGELVDRAERSGANAIFVQPQFAGAGAHAAADAMGVEVVEIDPLARDLVANLERIAVAISDSLGNQP